MALTLPPGEQNILGTLVHVVCPVLHPPLGDALSSSQYLCCSGCVSPGTLLELNYPDICWVVLRDKHTPLV